MSNNKQHFSSIANIDTIKNLNIAWFVLALLGAIVGGITCIISGFTLGSAYFTYGGILFGSIIPIVFMYITIKAFIGGLYDAKAIRSMLEEKEEEEQSPEVVKSSAYSCENIIIVFINDKFTMIENGKVAFYGRTLQNSDDNITLITSDNSMQMVLTLQDGCLVAKNGTTYKKVASK